ncbi:MAG: exodeoxyribonuclease III [Proteobacteria bacterium]|nr:exodeoxyribonuclease III [Pseudomonadota bacterium]
MGPDDTLARPEESRFLRVATWNVNGLRARLDFVLHWLAARRPDVVGLQELKLTDEQFPHDVFEQAGYRAVTHGQKSWNGVAILARGPLRVVQRGLPGQEGFGARLLLAEVDGLSFASLYCPNGKTLEHADYARKLDWYDSLSEYLRSSHDPRQPLVLGGDFNVCPSELDTWNEPDLGGGIFHTEAERGRVRSLLDWGLTDIFRQRRPEAREFSWWDYRGGAFHKRQGLRIDFLLATRPLLERVTRVEIDRDYRKKKNGLTASDHAPVMADLETK